VKDDDQAVPEANRHDSGATSADFPVAGTPNSIQEILSAQRMIAPLAEIIRKNNQGLALALSQQLALLVNAQAASLQNAMATISAVQIRKLAGAIPQASLWQLITAQLIPALERIRPAILGWLPANWQDTPGIRLTEAVTVINDGIPLIWVPRAAIAADLVSAPGAAARAAILVAASAEISDDCSAVLAEITRPELKPLAALAARAALALRADLPEPAQALAANVFDTCLREMASRGTILQPVSNRGWYGRVRKQIEPVGDETLLTEFRQACVMAPVLPALEDYMPGNPPPGTFARHATAHCASLDQYTDANAVISVMLATSVLREAEQSDW
jgi:hypothetical protein